jgi:hypothetical protein
MRRISNHGRVANLFKLSFERHICTAHTFNYVPSPLEIFDFPLLVPVGGRGRGYVPHIADFVRQFHKLGIVRFGRCLHHLQRKRRRAPALRMTGVA